MLLKSLLFPLLRPITDLNFRILRTVTTVSFNHTCIKNQIIIVNLDAHRKLNTRHRNQKVSLIANRSDASSEESKSRLISGMNFESPKDASPFTKLPIRTLIHIFKTTKSDEKNNFCKNRLYYIAHRIKCSPVVLSERLAQRTFIYSLSFDWLSSSLNVLLDMGVSGDRILRDLWVLKYNHITIHKRLQRVKDMGIETLYPWMVRCSEDILKRYISISRETKDILGDTKSTQIYLANRLNVTPEAVTEMCLKIPALQTIRVTKVKSFLDFLIREGFDVNDIVNKPRVLTASQKTVERRLDRLRKLGLTEINLNVLCRSRKDFKKYIESIANTSDGDNNT